MPAATHKSDLLHVSHQEFEKLQVQLDAVPERLRHSPDGEGTTLKDIVGHRAHWIELFLGWYAKGQEGVKVFFPAEGYKWSDLKRFNADLRAAQADLDWDGARSMLSHSHDQLLNWIKAHSDQELYGGPMNGANNQWTPGRWAEAAGPSHYRSATKYIRARIKAFNN